MSGTFPFLAQIACNYTMWEAQGIIFEYRPLSGEYGSANSNSLGKVILATNYDSSAPAFVNAQEMENYVGAISCKPAFGMRHGIETAPRERLTNLMYIRSGPHSEGIAPAGQKDRNLTDLGLFQIATEGIYANAAGQQVIGELWVSYRMVLTRPKLCFSVLGNGIPQDIINWGTSAASVANQFYNKPSNNLGGSLTTSAANILTYTFPQNIAGGTYRVVIVAFLTGANQVFAITEADCKYLKFGLPSRSVPQIATDTNNLYMASSVNSGAGQGLAVGTFDVVVDAPGDVQAVLVMIASTAFTASITAGISGNLFTITQVANTGINTLGYAA